MNPTTGLLATTAGAAAVFGGAMFAFSSFVMPALQALGPRDGLLAMQAINVAAPKSLLILPMGLLAVGVVGVILHTFLADGTDRGLRIAGALLGLAAIGITVAANVPLNDRLATLSAGPQSEGPWSVYVHSWTAWNHARVLASFGCAGLLGVAATRL